MHETGLAQDETAWGQNTQPTCNLPENQEFTRASWMNLGRHACRDGVAEVSPSTEGGQKTLAPHVSPGDVSIVRRSRDSNLLADVVNAERVILL